MMINIFELLRLTYMLYVKILLSLLLIQNVTDIFSNRYSLQNAHFEVNFDVM